MGLKDVKVGDKVRFRLGDDKRESTVTAVGQKKFLAINPSGFEFSIIFDCNDLYELVPPKPKAFVVDRYYQYWGGGEKATTYKCVYVAVEFDDPTVVLVSRGLNGDSKIFGAVNTKKSHIQECNVVEVEGDW